jgi:hypothetical protein
VLYAKALTDFRRGDFAPAAHAAAEAVEVFQTALDRHGEAYAHTALGMSSTPRDRAKAVHHFETSLAMGRELGETWLVMLDSSLMGWQAVLNAQLERAEHAFAEAISIGLEMGDLSQLTFGYLGSAGLAFVRNDPGGAQTHLKKRSRTPGSPRSSPSSPQAWKVSPPPRPSTSMIFAPPDCGALPTAYARPGTSCPASSTRSTNASLRPPGNV